MDTHETRAELHAMGASVEASRHYISGLKGELSTSQELFEQLSHEHEIRTTMIEQLRHELQVSRDDQTEFQLMSKKFNMELVEAQQRADRSAPQILDVRRCLDNAE